MKRCALRCCSVTVTYALNERVARMTKWSRGEEENHRYAISKLRNAVAELKAGRELEAFAEVSPLLASDILAPWRPAHAPFKRCRDAYQANPRSKSVRRDFADAIEALYAAIKNTP